MSRRFQLVAVFLILCLAGNAQAGDIVDRIVATVGKRAILQSELNEAIRYEMFAAGRPLSTVTIDDAKSTLNRIIDRQLIKNDIGETDAFVPSAEDVNKRIKAIRAQLPESATDAGWQSILQKYGLTENLVRERVTSELETTRMVNQRLRPNVRIDQVDIEAAYKNEFLPKLREAGEKEPPLSEVSSGIRQILVERHIGELLDTWLQGLRSQADVQIHLEQLKSTDPSSGSAAQTQPSKIDSGDVR